MSSLHPHWQQTEADEVPARPVDSVTRQAPAVRTVPVAQPATVSRRPAALVGIASAMITGFFLTQDLGSLLPAQLAGSDSTEIRITKDGLVPPVVTVPQGGSITWINEDTIPHILIAENLATASDPSLKTQSIFPNESQSVNISLKAKPGTYLYISQTSEFITGQIIVETYVAQASSTVTVAVASSQASSVIVPVQNRASSVPPVQEQAASSQASSVVRSLTPLPVNPYVAGSTPPPPPAGNVILPPRSSAPAAVTVHKPVANTSSGPALWLVVLGSLGGVLLVTRNSFRTIIPDRVTEGL